ncbi:chymotrypsinogen B-like [Saccoglossus kowalevskii]
MTFSDPVGRECVISGWGSFEYNAEISQILQEVQLTILDANDCYEYFVHKYTSEATAYSMMCAGNTGNCTGICFGDSGGPLVCNKIDGRWYLAGISSWMYCGCGDSKYSSGFSRVTSAHAWIQEIIANDSEQE